MPVPRRPLAPAASADRLIAVHVNVSRRARESLQLHRPRHTAVPRSFSSSSTLQRSHSTSSLHGGRRRWVLEHGSPFPAFARGYAKVSVGKLQQAKRHFEITLWCAARHVAAKYQPAHGFAVGLTVVAVLEFHALAADVWRVPFPRDAPAFRKGSVWAPRVRPANFEPNPAKRYISGMTLPESEHDGRHAVQQLGVEARMRRFQGQWGWRSGRRGWGRSYGGGWYGNEFLLTCDGPSR